MNAIVSGCAGFIGARVCELLLDRGDLVFGLDDMSDAYDPRLKSRRLEALEARDGFRFSLCDVSDEEALRAAFDGAGAFFGSAAGCVANLAARAGVRQSMENPRIYYSTNVAGTLNLLELCREREIGKFVLASTSSVYGTNDTPFDEDMATDSQLSPYASSKKAAEGICRVYSSLYGTDVSVLRYFTVYGPAGRPDMSVFRFVRWIEEGEKVKVLGDGNQERDFTYVDDIAAGTVSATENLGFEVINLGSGNPVSLNRLIEVIERKTGKRADVTYGPPHPSDVGSTRADVEKARRILGWEPSVDIETGVGNCVEWYRANRDLAGSVEL